MSEMTEVARCLLCGEPMPDGEHMFNFHGYSGPCPKPPLPKTSMESEAQILRNGLALILEQINDGGLSPQERLNKIYETTMAALADAASATTGSDGGSKPANPETFPSHQPIKRAR